MLKRRTEIQLPVNITFRCHGKRFDAIVKDMDGATTVYASVDQGAITFSVEAAHYPGRTPRLAGEKTETATAGLLQRDHRRIAVIATLSLGGPVSVPRVFVAAAALAGSMHPLIDWESLYQPRRKMRSFAVAEFGQAR